MAFADDQIRAAAMRGVDLGPRRQFSQMIAVAFECTSCSTVTIDLVPVGSVISRPSPCPDADQNDLDSRYHHHRRLAHMVPVMVEVG